MLVTGEFRYLQRRLQLCSLKCRLKCNDRINRENREQIFSSYYELETTEAQNVYLFSSLTTTTPKCLLVNAKQHREVSVSYTVNVAGQKVQVCKKAFLRLHAISQSKVDFIVNQCKAGLVTARPSFRGKHNNRPNRISHERRQKVHEHIRSFPADSSHYSRAKNHTRKYLSPILSINAMYYQYMQVQQIRTCQQ